MDIPLYKCRFRSELPLPFDEHLDLVIRELGISISGKEFPKSPLEFLVKLDGVNEFGVILGFYPVGDDIDRVGFWNGFKSSKPWCYDSGSLEFPINVVDFYSAFLYLKRDGK